MISIIQLVSHASVSVDGKTISAIQEGILALVGIEANDSEAQACKILDRILNFRIFPDQDGKSNLSLKAIKGGLLLVPQFTLVAETNRGTRPGFSRGMPPNEAEVLFECLVQHAKKVYPNIESGKFGENMQVTLCNNGPMTFILSS